MSGLIDVKKLRFTERPGSANRTLVPIHCRVVKDLNHFDGAWTVRDFLHSIWLTGY